MIKILYLSITKEKKIIWKIWENIVIFLDFSIFFFLLR